MFRAVVPGAITAIAVLACSTARESPTPVGSVQQANQGVPTTAHRHSVGVCMKATGPGACGGTCSGTLIAPNLVLTARHCIDNDTNPGTSLVCGVDTFTTRSSTVAQVFVTTHNVIAQPSVGWHTVSEIRTPTATDGCGADIALLVLQDNVAAAEAPTADVLAFGSMADHSRYSTEVAVVGYGLAAFDQPGTAGQRRILEHVPIQCIPGDSTFDDFVFCKNGGMGSLPDGGTLDILDDAANFSIYWGVCQGDSGSAAFEQSQFTLGKPLVMGVLSRSGGEGSVCVQAAYTRTDAWRDFLVAGATAAATAGSYPLPAWAQGPTVAATDAGFGGAIPKPPDAATDAKPVTPAVDASPPPPPGEKGVVCSSPADCASGACVAAAGRRAACVEACGPDRSCPATESCLAFEQGEFCVSNTTSSTTAIDDRVADDGCSIGPGRSLPSNALAIGLALLATALRRRRPQ